MFQRPAQGKAGAIFIAADEPKHIGRLSAVEGKRHLFQTPLAQLTWRQWGRQASLTGQRAVERRASHVQKVGNVLPRLAFVEELPRVVDLLRRQFHLPTELHAPALRGLHSGAGALGDQRPVCLTPFHPRG